MNKLHQAYLNETGGRNVRYAAWLEKKLDWFASGYEEMLLLVRDAHRTLKYGSEDERIKLVNEMEAGLKDWLIDDEKPEVKQP